MAWFLLNSHSGFFSDDISELCSVDVLEFHGFFYGEFFDFILSENQLNLIIECGPHIFHSVFWSPVWVLFVLSYTHLDNPVVLPYLLVLFDTVRTT